MLFPKDSYSDKVAILFLKLDFLYGKWLTRKNCLDYLRVTEA